MGRHGRDRLRLAATAALVAICAATTAAQPAPPPSELTSDLAARIATLLPARSQVSVAAGDASGSDAGIRDAVSALLDERRFRVVDGAAGVPLVRVGCRDNLRERACVAEVLLGVTRHLVFATRAHEPGAARALGGLALQLRPLFSQRAPILDVAGFGQELLVLEPSAVTRYRPAGAGWNAEETRAVPSSRVLPRDARGRLQVSGSRIEAFLPGVVCSGSGEPLTLTCADRQERWPLDIENAGLQAARNYFTTPEGLAFYSAARVGYDDDATWLVVGRDGILTLLDARRVAVGRLQTASEVASLGSSCDSDSHVLTAVPAAGGDRTDAIQVSRLVGRQLVPAAAAVAVPGVVTAMWAAPGSPIATLVVRAADRYEAFHVSLACDR